MGNEDDLTSRAREYESPQIALGRVGWEGSASHFEKGNPYGVPAERMTLVRVTLSGSLSVRGQRVLCRLSGLVGTRIPKPNTPVLIATPFEMSDGVGVGVIIATLENDPERLEDDRRVLDFPGEHVIIRGKSVTIESEDSEFVAVGTPRSGGTSGVTIQAKDGSGAIWQVGVASMFVAKDGDAKSVLQMTPERAELIQKASGFMRLGGGEIVVLSKGKAAYIAGNTYIGSATMPVPPLGAVAHGPQPGAVSTTVFVSP
jgi:hypothetical protein